MKKATILLLMLMLAAPALAAPNTPEEFSDWFIAQEFKGQDYHQWAAILNALTDGIDRSREARQEIKTPVYVAILTGTVYHNESCPSLSRASRVLELDLAEAQERGFEECKICQQPQDLEAFVGQFKTLQDAYEALRPILGTPVIVASPRYVDNGYFESFPAEISTYTYIVWIIDDVAYELSSDTWIEIQKLGNSFTGYEYEVRDSLLQLINFDSFPAEELEQRMSLYD